MNKKYPPGTELMIDQKKLAEWHEKNNSLYVAARKPALIYCSVKKDNAATKEIFLEDNEIWGESRWCVDCLDYCAINLTKRNKEKIKLWQGLVKS